MTSNVTKKVKGLLVAATMLVAIAVPGVASAAPADGRCVSNGVRVLRDAIPTVAPSGAVAGIILSHAFEPGSWDWC